MDHRLSITYWRTPSLTSSLLPSLAIINTAFYKHSYTGYRERKFSTPLGECQRVRLLDGKSSLIRRGLDCTLSFGEASWFCIPTSNEWEIWLLHAPVSIWCCQYSGCWPCNRCGVEYIALVCIPDDIWCGKFFPCAYLPTVCLPWWGVFLRLWPFFN